MSTPRPSYGSSNGHRRPGGLAPEPQRRAPEPGFLARHGSRTLDPARALRFEGQRLGSTVYAGDSLLIRITPNEEEVLAALRRAADATGVELDVDDVDEQVRDLARAAGIGPEEDQPLLLRATVRPRSVDGAPVSPPDAWRVLQTYRSFFRSDRRSRDAVQLNHLLTSQTVTPTPYWHGSATPQPYWHGSGTPQPYWHGPGTAGPAEYAQPGFGGRVPVAFVGPPPARTPDAALSGRRPVVAVLDTGVGEHPWLPGGVVDRHPRCGDLPIGLVGDVDDIASDPLTGMLEPTSGHGTFIAGLVRQTCPDANLLAIRVVEADGVVAEDDLLRALNMLWLRQKLAMLQRRPADLVDVVSLSLGYYHEELGDEAFDPLLLAPLRALGRLGVAVVTSAGNDATVRPMFPAAFAPWPSGPVRTLADDEVGVLAVGAENPDGSIALFSNDGPWVTVHRPGAALVSTVPRHDAARSASLDHRPGADAWGVDGAPGSRRPRSTLDPDDYSSGFAVWSGTSFAAPILAGQLAQALLGEGTLGDRQTDLDPDRAVARARSAVRTCTTDPRKEDR